MEPSPHDACLAGPSRHTRHRSRRDTQP